MGYFLKHKSIIIYGVSLAMFLFLLKWLEFRLLIVHNAFEIYIGLIAVLFTGLGIWLALKLTRPQIQTVVVEKEVRLNMQENFVVNDTEIQRLGLSKRELEVLQLIADGLTNQEIASRLFVSLNTIKTHSSKVFEKMEVRSRTQAVEKARRQFIIP